MQPTLMLTPQDFCYWLQGAIEIGSLQNIDAATRQKILDKLDNLQHHDRFTHHCEMLLKHYDNDEDMFPFIRDALQAMFVHDIDPSYEGDQEVLLAIHHGSDTP